MFAKIKTGTKILAGFGIAIAITLLVGFVAYRAIAKLNVHIEELTKNNVPSLQGLGEMRSAQMQIGYYTLGLSHKRLSADPQYRAHCYDGIDTGLKQFEEGRKIYETTPQTTEEAATWRECISLVDKWKEFLRETLEASRERDRLLAATAAGEAAKQAAAEDKLLAGVNDLKAARGAMGKKLEAIMEINVQGAAATAKESTEQASAAITTMATAVPLAVVAMLVIGALLARSVSSVLRIVIGESQRLSAAAVEGKLQTRGNPELVSLEFRPIVEGVNATLDAVIGPLNVAAEYVDRISKGDIPAKITDSYNGDFNEIKNNLNQCIEAVNAMSADAVMLAKAAVDGKLATRADAAKHRGDFRKIVQGVNDTLDAVIGPMNDAAAALKAMAAKDFTKPIEGDYAGDFRALKDSVNAVVENIRSAIGQITESASQFAEGSRTIAESARPWPRVPRRRAPASSR